MDTSLPFSETEALAAVRNRDAAYDGRLFFAVVTTGIYCKPSCSSRAANAENLRFYASAATARDQGFRACKRCSPENVPADSNPVVKIARYIESHADQKLTLTDLSKRFDFSSTYLQKVFKQNMGVSPKAFQAGIRQQRFKALLKKDGTVTDAVFNAGFGSTSRAYENTADQLGMTPAEYKAGAKGKKISYICAATSAKMKLGFLMLAATDKGVCFSMFGSSESVLLSMLAEEFPAALLVKAQKSEQIKQWFAAIDQHLETATPLPEIPLDLQGTAFQLRVWSFLQSIAMGDVLSYSDVALGIGQPKAVRAAATACGKNRIAMLVPCHRVLRNDGTAGGYRWGVEIKKKLLELEQYKATKKKTP